MNDLIWREDALNALNLVDAPFLPMNTNEHIAYVYALKNLPAVDALRLFGVRTANIASTESIMIIVAMYLWKR